MEAIKSKNIANSSYILGARKISRKSPSLESIRENSSGKTVKIFSRHYEIRHAEIP
jgi:hypothetical protein